MGLIREAEWTEGGHRLYDESVFERLSRIVEMKKTKSLTEIRRILKGEEEVTPSAAYPAGDMLEIQDIDSPSDTGGFDTQEGEDGEDMKGTTTG
jgi:DNA-binding transcriptional MerR regulator